MPEDTVPLVNPIVNASPLRRIGAMLYDCLLCAAVLMIAGLLFVPFNGPDHQLHGAALYVQRLWLLSVWLSFFVYFWTRKGKTLGMQAWKLVIETAALQKPTVRDALLRIVAATVPWLPGYIVLSIASAVHNTLLVKVGLALLLLVLVNYLLGYLDPQRRALHDRLLKTKIVFARKKVVSAAS
jgi:uncharacterized RDD family membrane protein YckC